MGHPSQGRGDGTPIPSKGDGHPSQGRGDGTPIPRKGGWDTHPKEGGMGHPSQGRGDGTPIQRKGGWDTHPKEGGMDPPLDLPVWSRFFSLNLHNSAWLKPISMISIPAILKFSRLSLSRG